MFELEARLKKAGIGADALAALIWRELDVDIDRMVSKCIKGQLINLLKQAKLHTWVDYATLE